MLLGPLNCEINYEEAVKFDPIKHHSCLCPLVNGNLAGTCCGSSSGSNGVSVMALCAWKLTLDALEDFQSLGHVSNQIRESKHADLRSLYKDDHLINGPKLWRTTPLVEAMRETDFIY
ncbi:Rsm1 domain-containing protein [Heracleum sosnowskyi]|uniref:Rsm1 domain-containing protein n=1 Tax=Heracleum sosnowskyi TaxID=360622 RepID=A0AAD8H8I8_9APIA|nr:Rsm1 domain-containing protein [Heracleum sosnowskyi]